MLCLLFFIQRKKNGHSFSSGDKEGDGLGGGKMMTQMQIRYVLSDLPLRWC